MPFFLKQIDAQITLLMHAKRCRTSYDNVARHDTRVTYVTCELRQCCVIMFAQMLRELRQCYGYDARVTAMLRELRQCYVTR